MTLQCQVAGNAEYPRSQMLLGLFLLNVAEQVEEDFLDNFLRFASNQAERQQISEERNAQFVE